MGVMKTRSLEARTATQVRTAQHADAHCGSRCSLMCAHRLTANCYTLRCVVIGQHKLLQSSGIAKVIRVSAHKVQYHTRGFPTATNDYMQCL